LVAGDGSQTFSVGWGPSVLERVQVMFWQATQSRTRRPTSTRTRPRNPRPSETRSVTPSATELPASAEKATLILVGSIVGGVVVIAAVGVVVILICCRMSQKKGDVGTQPLIVPRPSGPTGEESHGLPSTF
jgi:hypothetical protein